MTDQPSGRVDALTGVAGPDAWAEALNTERLRRIRYRRPLVLMSVDVERLEEAAERHGLAAADGLLLATADILRSALRESDFIARVAAGQFRVLLPETHPAAMEDVVARLQEAAGAWSGAVEDLGLSLAIGWAAPEPFGDLREASRASEQRRRVVRGSA
jgi:diguanylate cyclase (GGDEF)-like protein